FAVGAYCWQNNALEPFSSLGPTIDGRIKPDIGGPDQNSTQTFGPFGGCASFAGFPGTSAAAPHVTGAAALVKQANPGFGPAQLRSFLTSRAVDASPPGPDNQLGAGRLFLGTSPQPAFSANPAPGSQIALTGQPGVGVTRTIAVTNTGQTGTVLSVSLSVLSPGYTLTGAPLQLGPGAGGTLTVGCRPPAAAGSLVLATNDPLQPTVSYPLSCVAQTAAYAGSLPSGSSMAII